MRRVCDAGARVSGQNTRPRCVTSSNVVHGYASALSEHTAHSNAKRWMKCQCVPPVLRHCACLDEDRRVRGQLVTVQGAAVPLPYGGKNRVVNIDVDPDALYARGLSPQDVLNATLLQNIIVTPGTAKMGPSNTTSGSMQPGAPERAERHPDPVREWRAGLRPGCGLRPRRVHPADQPRSARRPALRAASGPDQR